MKEQNILLDAIAKLLTPSVVTLTRASGWTMGAVTLTKIGKIGIFFVSNMRRSTATSGYADAAQLPDDVVVGSRILWMGFTQTSEYHDLQFQISNKKVQINTVSTPPTYGAYGVAIYILQ